jgi:trans-aconitate 2-methyltransferase
LTTPRDWDAEAYESLAEPQDAWGLRILGLLDLAGDETVLEAGCGTGRDTARLLERLPDGRVIALDGSARMLERLRTRLAGRMDRVEVVQADLARPLPLNEPVDVVFSVAAFHWVQDHAALFSNLAAVMRPGARLVADCGGKGNIARVSAAVEKVTGVPAESGIWNFSEPETTRLRLAGAGFSDIQVELQGDVIRLPDRRLLERFLTAVVLGSHLEAMPEGERGRFVERVADQLPEAEIDYVRLTISAVRTG